MGELDSLERCFRNMPSTKREPRYESPELPLQPALLAPLAGVPEESSGIFA